MFKNDVEDYNKGWLKTTLYSRLQKKNMLKNMFSGYTNFLPELYIAISTLESCTDSEISEIIKCIDFLKNLLRPGWDYDRNNKAIDEILNWNDSNDETKLSKLLSDKKYIKRLIRYFMYNNKKKQNINEKFNKDFEKIFLNFFEGLLMDDVNGMHNIIINSQQQNDILKLIDILYNDTDFWNFFLNEPRRTPSPPSSGGRKKKTIKKRKKTNYRKKTANHKKN